MRSFFLRKATILICGLLLTLLLAIGALLQPVSTQGAIIDQSGIEADLLHLPLILKLYPEPIIPPTPTQTPPPGGDVPQDGSWAGTTSHSHPMSYTVQSGGTQWAQFKLNTDFVSATCGASGTIEITVPGPGSISNGYFSYDSGTYDFSGDFSSSTVASGSYAFTNYQITIGLPWPPYICFDYLTQSGTWNASP